MNKKLVAVAVSSALLAPMAAQAITFKVGGHVSRAIIFADDGIDSDVSNVDNTNSGTRFRFTGSDDLGVGGMKAGMRIELGTQSNTADNFAIKRENGTGGGNDSVINIRHSYVWFSGKWGQLNMGHTSSAFDGTMDADMSGDVGLAGVAATSIATYGSSVGFRTNAGANVGVTVGGATSAFDGGREDVLRYDTPKFGPFSARVSVGDNSMYDFRLRANGKFSGVSYDVRGGYQDDTHSAGREQWGVSGSVLFSQGTNLTLQYSERELLVRTGPGGNGDGVFGGKLRDTDTFYAKLGHRWGNNSVAIDYAQTDDLSAANDEYTSWGIGIAHRIPGPRVQIHASYRNHDLDRPGVNVEDIDVFGVGARIQF